MPVNHALREQMYERFDDMKLIDDADQCIVGVGCVVDGHRIIYDHELLVQHFMSDGTSRKDAVEWIDYNIVGANDPSYPIVMFSVKDFT